MRWASSQGVSPSAARRGTARLGMVWRGAAGQGSARTGWVGQGPQTVARRGLPSLPSSRMDVAWPGAAWHGELRWGTAWHGGARQGQRGGYSPRCLHCPQLRGLKLDCSRPDLQRLDNPVDRATCACHRLPGHVGRMDPGRYVSHEHSRRGRDCCRIRSI